MAGLVAGLAVTTKASLALLPIGGVALVAVVGILGFIVGRENDRFLTCSDFAIAGSAEPENCARSDG